MLNKLWKGLFMQKWILLYTVLVAILFSYWTFNYCCDIVHAFFNPSIEEGGTIDAIKGIALGSGSGKFLLIVLFEVIIFHFAVQTLNAVKGENLKLTLKDFIKAEKRMIFVMFISYMLSRVIKIILSGVLEIAGVEKIAFVFMFFVSSYFIGHSFFDNYNEQYKIRPKASRYVTWQYWPATLTLGLVCAVFMAIPIIGPICAPILGAVAATLYGHRVAMHKEFIPMKYRRKKDRVKKVKSV